MLHTPTPTVVTMNLFAFECPYSHIRHHRTPQF